MANDSSDEERKRRDTPPPLEFVRPEDAQGPLPSREQPPAAWVPRPEEYQPPTWTPPTAAAPSTSNLPKLAGVFLILSAILGMAGAIINAISILPVSEYANITQNNPPELLATLQVCFLISVWSQAMALLGGVMAFQRMNWRLTLVCAVFSLLTLGYFLIDASLVGLGGLILTVLARRYFIS